MFEEARRELRTQSIRIGEQVQSPDPRDHAKRQFETARPVDAELRRIRIHPRRSVCDECFSKSFIAGQPICLAERNEMRVTVQFPDNFLITRDVRVEIIDLAPVNERRAFPGCRVEMPIDLIAKTQIVEAEQIKAPGDRAFGRVEQSLAISGEALLDDLAHLLSIRERRKKRQWNRRVIWSDGRRSDSVDD